MANKMTFDNIEEGYNNNDKKALKRERRKTTMVAVTTGIMIIALLAAFGTILGLYLSENADSDSDSGPTVITDENPGHNNGEQSEPQTEGVFRHAAVASNTELCAKVGKDILLLQGGSAVDAAIATLACVGLVRFHSSGVGGDSFWTFYHRETARTYVIISRSMAPLASNETMFVNRTELLQEGGLSIAVPGEILAFKKAHEILGRIPWKDLFQPTINMAKNGFPMEPTTASAIASKVRDGTVQRFPELSAMLTNPDTNDWYKEGEIIRLPKLAETYRRIAEGGAEEFYNGTLADEMVKEIQDAGGIITKQDFESYWVDVTDPLELPLHGNLRIFSPPLPSGGLVVQNILNILSGYKMTPDDLSTNEKTILTYHRHLEAFKHAYAARSKMGSPYGETADFQREMEELTANLTNLEEGEAIRKLISDSQTFPWEDYNPAFHVSDDHGTSHMSVLAPNGDAVSVTSTINFFFGSKIVGNVTGIVYNDLMDDFSTPGVKNGFNVEPSPANYIKPGKRPLSSMSPSIILDQNNETVLIVGAAGGPKIISTTAYLTSMTLWLGKDIQPAIAGPRIHHQLYPDEAWIHDVAPQWLVDGLKEKGHTVRFSSSLSSPNGILQKDGKILADAQGSAVDGY